MTMKKLKRLGALALTLALGMSVLSGCSNDAAAEGGRNLIYNLGEDPDTIDPTLNTSVGSSTIIASTFEGLMILDENEEATYGVASDMQISEDQLTYTFTIRDDAKWSDGQKVTANDFKFSWLRALNPATAAEYAYQLFYIKNGEAYNSGEATAEEVGIEVVDESTLKVTLEAPTVYFPELMAFPTYMPLREDIVSANEEGWATNPETYISNGPFKLVEWSMKDRFVVVKNENYWNADSIKLPGIEFLIVTDENTAYSSLQSGEFDMVDTVPSAEIEDAVNSGLATIYPNLATYMLIINVGKQDTLSPDVQEALSNPLVRKALSLAIDRKAIVERVTKAGQVPAYSFVPQGILNEEGEDFASVEYYDANQANIEEAKKLLAEAGYPNGEGLPTLEFMYNSEGSHKDVAQVIQQDWAKIGVNVTLTNQEWKVFLNTRQEGQYQIARHGWSGDYVDPMTFLDLWVTDGGNNDAGYSNAEYDELVAKAKAESDQTKRWEYMHQAEAILMEEMPIIPLYYYTKVKAAQDYVKGVRVSALGHTIFNDAYLDIQE